MLSKIRKNLYKSDDVKFSQDISTAEGRRKKIRVLRRTRLNFIGPMLLGFLIFALSLVLQLMQSFLVTNTNSGSVTFGLIVSVFLIANSSVNYYNNDSQIKMLLLFEQTQPKG